MTATQILDKRRPVHPLAGVTPTDMNDSTHDEQRTSDPQDWDRLTHEQLRDLWEALNDAISQQHQDTQNEISDAYRLHRLYAKHFPEDYELAKQELEDS